MKIIGVGEDKHEVVGLFNMVRRELGGNSSEQLKNVPKGYCCKRFAFWADLFITVPSSVPFFPLTSTFPSVSF